MPNVQELHGRSPTVTSPHKLLLLKVCLRYETWDLGPNILRIAKEYLPTRKESSKARLGIISKGYRRARKGPYASSSVSGKCPQGCHRSSGLPMLSGRTHTASDLGKKKCRLLPFSTPLSFRTSMLQCSALTLRRKVQYHSAPLCCQDVDFIHSLV